MDKASRTRMELYEMFIELMSTLTPEEFENLITEMHKEIPCTAKSLPFDGLMRIYHSLRKEA